MDKAKLGMLLVMLYAQEIAARSEMVKQAAKENGVKEGELYKLLKEAGYDSKTPKGTAAPGENNGGADPSQQSGADGYGSGMLPGYKTDGVKKTAAVLRHKTEYPRYRRAGLVLTQKAEAYEVSDDQLAALKKDPWVIIEKGGEGT